LRFILTLIAVIDAKAVFLIINSVTTVTTTVVLINSVFQVLMVVLLFHFPIPDYQTFLLAWQ